MLKIRYYLRLTRAFLNKFKGMILIGMIFGIIAFVSISLIMPIFLKQTIRIGSTGRYQSNNLPFYVQDLISDGLTKINSDLTVSPSLSDSWEVADNGKIWKFHLGNVFWQDESLVTSFDINYEFSDVEIEKPDDKTILFKLKEEFSPFPSVVSKPIFKKGLLGTGGWEVDNVILTSTYISQLELVNLSDSKPDKMVFKFYPTEEQTKLAYKMGVVDEIRNVLDPKPFDEWGNSLVETHIDDKQIVTLFFNLKDKSLSEKNLRQALNYSLDKTLFQGKPALGPIPEVSWAYNPQIKTYDHDHNRAQELLDNLSDEFVSEIQIKLVTSPPLLSIAEVIAKEWNEFGIDTTVQVSSIVPKEYSAFLAIYEAPNDPDQYPIWHSTQTETNISNYSNPRIDKLLEDGRKELDRETRKKIYFDFQRFLAEDVPAIFLYNPYLYTIKKK